MLTGRQARYTLVPGATWMSPTPQPSTPFHNASAGARSLTKASTRSRVPSSQVNLDHAQAVHPCQDAATPSGGDDAPPTTPERRVGNQRRFNRLRLTEDPKWDELAGFASNSPRWIIRRWRYAGYFPPLSPMTRPEPSLRPVENRVGVHAVTPSNLGHRRAGHCRLKDNPPLLLGRP